MMKKVLALVLALLLLSASAVAEPMCFELTLSADEANLTEILKSSGVFAGADEDELCAAMAKLINDTGLRIISQDDGGFVDLLVSGKSFIDLQFITDSEQLVLTSTLINGSGISIPADDMEAVGTEMAQLVESVDPLVILQILIAVEEELQSVEMTSTRGSFSGHAYTGGVYCETYTFDDAKIAAILNAVLTDEVCATIISFCNAMGEDGEALLKQIDEKNQQVAAENAYRYILRFVRDDTHQPIGASVVILQGDRQLATLSLGWSDEHFQLVAAFALEDVNYWHSHGVDYVLTEKDGVSLLQLSGTLVEFTAPKEDDFSYAMAVSGTETMQSVWGAVVKEQGENLAWEFTSQQRYGENAPVEMIQWNGAVESGKAMSSKMSFSASGKEYLVISMSSAPCEAISADTSGLTIYSIAEEEQLYEVAYSFGTEIAMRLLKVIPLKLLMYAQ